MTEEHLTILRMVAEKKITAEEGERLLEALGAGTRTTTPPKPEQKGRSEESRSFKTWTFGFKNPTKGEGNPDVEASFVREMRELGFDIQDVRQLVEMRIHGVKPEFVREMKELGLDIQDVRQLVEMRIHGVKPDFIREMRELGFNDLSPRQLIEMSIHGVTPDFVRKMKALGFENLTAHQLVEMKIHGVN